MPNYAPNGLTFGIYNSRGGARAEVSYVSSLIVAHLGNVERDPPRDQFVFAINQLQSCPPGWNVTSNDWICT